jgi:hypothetical protein
MLEKEIPKKMINKIERHYYLIDEIRAKELLKSEETGNKFMINYYYRVPVSTMIWSLSKSIATSKWAIPINWAEYCFRTKVSLDNLWSYYAAKGLNLYDYAVRFDMGESVISNLFRGPEDSDTIIFCPYSGFPIKFSSWNYYAHKENRGKEKKFYLDISDKYFPEWLTEQHRLAWWGKEGRNEPMKKDKFFRVKNLEPEKLVVGADYYAEVLQPYLIQEGYIVDEPIQPIVSLEEPENFYEEENYSDSDMLEEYYRDNPLNENTDDEEDPYRNLSSSSGEEAGD